ncbi:MAG TPA: ATP-binding protein [Spirochaetota bacterium]|nr:ATP-binding protein [Spirochaetota bacterium]HNT11714.1 ATP-binding protein [Spirochaetota bacterium]HNV48903.1 ATP-binding protein [Spirochaetota bacterium]HOS40382.1 ATP-binding protein [Spirochaetota bacterium]HPU90407.1 ATP-binding protein [Spirochaetota bacterium]
MSESGKIEIFKATYPSKREIRKDIINALVNAISQNNIKIKINENELYLIIDEALTNAMEHGNKWDPAKSVSLRMVKNGKHLHLEIKDQGPGFKPESNAIDANNIKNLKPRGRGIYIIKQFCSPRWSDNGNTVDLQIELVN